MTSRRQHEQKINDADLTKAGLRAKEIITRIMDESGLKPPEGVEVFKTPKEWENRGELGWEASLLIITYDGGDHTQIFDPDTCLPIKNPWYWEERIHEELEKEGMSMDRLNHWASAVYWS